MIDTLLLVITIAAPLAMLVIEKKKELYSENGTATKAGVWFIVIALLGAVAGLSVGIKNNADQNAMKNNVDSLIKKTNTMEDQLNTIGYKSNEVTGKLEKIDSQTKANNSNVFVVSSKPKEVTNNPLLNTHEGARFYSGNEDSMIISLSIKNFDKGVAKNINENFMGISQIKDFYLSNSSITQLHNKEHIIPGGGVYSYYINYRFTNQIPYDKQFLFMKVSYTNDSGKSMPPLRQIFLIPYPKLNNVIYDASIEDYNKIKDFLQKRKLW